MNESIQETLLILKKDIELTKQELNRKKGKADILIDQLQKEFGCDSLEEAQEILESIAEDIETISKKLRQDMEKLDKERKKIIEINGESET